VNKNIRGRFSEQKRVVSIPQGESLAQQHMRDETDINTIVGRYLKTGVLGSGGGTRQPIFGDFSAVDYHEMRNAIADIQQNFDGLPARTRRRFNNDPYQLIRFVENPVNLKASLKMGLIPVPEGHVMDEAGNLVEEMDIFEPHKSDAEANPTFRRPDLDAKKADDKSAGKSDAKADEKGAKSP